MLHLESNWNQMRPTRTSGGVINRVGFYFFTDTESSTRSGDTAREPPVISRCLRPDKSLSFRDFRVLATAGCNGYPLRLRACASRTRAVTNGNSLSRQAQQLPEAL